MGRGKNKRRKKSTTSRNKTIKTKPKINSLIDNMEEGREYESLLKYDLSGIDFSSELKKILGIISEIREKPVACYISNVINPNIKTSRSIDRTDELPFSEMIESIDSDKVDFIISTPGGSASQVDRFVNSTRRKFDQVSFILPSIAMSAGTIWIMSGDEIVMDSRAYIGPIDPQIQTKSGVYPAQAIITLIDRIQKEGQKKIDKRQNPNWTDMHILNQIDPKEIGNAYNASDYSVRLVQKYLTNYKFRTWTVHNKTGKPVTGQEKIERAEQIAKKLCDHSYWKSHVHGITREDARNDCKLKITHSETDLNFHNALRKFWALMHWVFNSTLVYKIYATSNDFVMLRVERKIIT